MKVTDELIDRLAELAKLEFDFNSKKEIKKDLERMLDFVDKLNGINTDNTEPLVYLSEYDTLLRDDIPKNAISQKDALKNAPKHDSDYFKVPKVIEKDN